MVDALIRMKLAMLRGSLRGRGGVQPIIGLALGVGLGLATLLLGAAPALPTRMAGDVLALVLLVWTVGWLIGPLFAGSGRGDLRAEFFARSPLRPSRLTGGLLVASFIGIGPAVTVVALAGVIALGFRLGPGPALVAIPATFGALTILVLGSRVMVGAVGEAIQSRRGAALAALPWAVVIAAVCDAGVLLYALGQAEVLNRGLDPWLSDLVRILPSGWSVLVIEAADRGSWSTVSGALGAMAVLAAALLGIWSVLVGRRIAGASVRRRTPGGSTLKGGSTLGAVIGKERRTWSRDMLRSYYWYFAIAFGVSVCTLPLLAGVTWYLPWAGTLIAISGAAVGVNMYSADGSALWLILMTPRALEADVRGRQLAWLWVVGPTSLLVTACGLALSGQWTVGPWVAALNILALGAGAGYMVFLAVAAPPRIPDVGRRGPNPAAEGGNLAGADLGDAGLDRPVCGHPRSPSRGR